MYNGNRVAMKTARVVPRDNINKIRMVRINGIPAPTCGVVSTTLPQRFYREISIWRRLSHPNILKLVGVQEDTRKGQFVTVSEWMEHGTIMDFTKKNHTNRLELVRGSAFYAVPPLKCYNSCTGRPRVWSTSMRLVSPTGTSKGLAFLRSRPIPF